MIIVILFIVNLTVFWGLFYIFFGSWDKFRDTFESAMGWDYWTAGFDGNRILIFLMLCASLVGSEYFAVQRYWPHLLLL